MSDHGTSTTFLVASLKAWLSLISSGWLKAGGTFVTELVDKLGHLPLSERSKLLNGSDEEISVALLQVDLAVKHAAFAAAGITRIEDQIFALRAAIDEADRPMIIKFPGTKSVATGQRRQQHRRGNR